MTPTHMPAGAGPATPEKDNARGQAGVIGGQDRTANPNSADGAEAAQRCAKAWATVQARCALAGFRADLIEGDDGQQQLIVTRWALTRSFATPVEVETWLQRVEARG